jgi:uncharacterized membrane protein (DUF4010 family)
MKLAKQPIVLFFLILVSLFFIPNKTLDPWGFFNLHNLVLVVFVLASLQLISYFLTQVLGEKTGMMLTGFLGGLVSSTSVFLNLSEKKDGHASLKAAAAVLATVAMLLEAYILLLVFSRELVIQFGFTLLVMIFVGFLVAYRLGLNRSKDSMPMKKKKYLDFSSTIKMAFFISLVLFSISATKKWAGTEATLFLSFLSGLFELHGVFLQQQVCTKKVRFYFTKLTRS